MKKLLKKADIQNLYLTGITIVLAIFSIAVLFIFSHSFNSTFETNVQNIEEDIFQNQKNLLQNQVTALVKRIEVRRKKGGKILQGKVFKHNSTMVNLLNYTFLNSKADSSDIRNLIVAYNKSIDPLFFVAAFDANGKTVFLPDVLAEKKGDVISEVVNKRSKLIRVNTSKGMALLSSHYNKNFGYYIVTGGFYYLTEKKIKNDIIQVLNHKSSVELGKNEYFFIQQLSQDPKGNIKLQCIVNPTEKVRVNKSVNMDEKDADGKFYHRNYIEKILNNKNPEDVFLIHSFIQEGHKNQRITYYYLYKPWNWIFARGFYIKKINDKIFQEKNYLKEKFLSEIKTNIFLFIVILFFTGVISWLFARRIGKIFGYYNHLVQSQNKDLKTKNENLMLEFNLREKIEKALQSNEELYHSTIDSLTDSIIVINSQNRVLMVNETFEKFLRDHFNIKQSIGSDLFTLNSFFDSLKEYFLKVSTSKEIFTIQEKRVINNKEEYFEFRIIPLVASDQSIRRYITIIRDLTQAKMKEIENRSMEVKMLSQSKMATLGEMATSIAHEIYQPLNFISGFIQLLEIDLQNDQIDKNGLGEMIYRTHRSIKRITDIIDHLRIFGRADQIEKTSVKLNNLLENTLILLQERMRIRSIELDIQIAEKIKNIKGNETQLEQVFINLFQNSLDAFEDHDIKDKKISIIAMQKNKKIQIHYSDNAGGMKDEVKARIFEPFFTTKEVGKGTGLGMAIIYGIIKDHGGEITIETQIPKGSTFKFDLPVYE